MAISFRRSQARVRVLPAMSLVSLACFCWLHSLDFSTLDTAQIDWKTRHKVQSRPVLSFNNILFVNIRKSGGSEIKAGFRAFTSKRKMINSTLSNRVTASLHTNEESKPKGAIKTVDAYLYNLRHPIDRMLAWYLYEHPASCLNERETPLACKAAKDVTAKPKGDASIFFRKCFPTQDYLPLAFTDRISRKCTKLAQQVIENNVKGPGFRQTPFHYDIRYYANKTIDQHPNKTVLVVRSESIFEDLYDLELKLGGNGTFQAKKNYHDRVASDELTHYYGPLCCVIQKEMFAYRRLLMLSANLDDATKETTIARAANRCGFSSWSEMEQQFQRH